MVVKVGQTWHDYRDVSYALKVLAIMRGVATCSIMHAGKPVTHFNGNEPRKRRISVATLERCYCLEAS